jgi:iron complex transport system substrate-binding protein
MRIVSVLPSATEIVFALGHGTELVGRSAECDFPPEAARLPVVMRPRTLDPERPSREIDARVRAARGAHESLYDLDIGQLRSLRPDLLLTQDLCGVCSVTDEEVASACAEAGVRPQIVSLAPRRLGDVWASVEAVGRAVGDPDRGVRQADRLRERSRPRPSGSPLKVAIVEWLDPPILAGLWAPDMVAVAGGQPVGPSAGAPGLRTDWRRIADMAPDLVVLSPCSFSVDRTRRELDAPDLSTAVASVRPSLGTFVADEAYFSRPGPRLVEGIDLVQGLLRRSGGSHPMPVARWNSPTGGVTA